MADTAACQTRDVTRILTGRVDQSRRRALLSSSDPGSSGITQNTNPGNTWSLQQLPPWS